MLTFTNLRKSTKITIFLETIFDHLKQQFGTSNRTMHQIASKMKRYACQS